MMRSRFVAALLLMPVAACIGPNPNLRIEDTSQIALDRVSAARAIEVLDSSPSGSATVGPVEGTSCQNAMWDPKATEAAALDQMKIKAADLGATALVGVSYSSSGTSLVANCWTVVTATGTAIKR